MKKIRKDILVVSLLFLLLLGFMIKGLDLRKERSYSYETSLIRQREPLLNGKTEKAFVTCYLAGALLFASLYLLFLFPLEKDENR